MSKVFQANF